jgi:hypothetical protein
MHALMNFQTALLPDQLVTHLTSTMVLTIMFALMSYQRALLSECLIKHVTM